MATILGLSYGHGGSACIVKDGRLIVALTDERIVRHKFSHGLSDPLLDYIFEWTNTKPEDIDYIAISDWNEQYAKHSISVKENGVKAECLWNTVFDNLCLQLDVEWNGTLYPGFHIGHQLGHAAAAYYTSPFEESYCFAMDASGATHQDNSVIAYGNGEKLLSMYCPWLMVGVAYGFFTEFLGIGSQIFKAGSTMALAGFGKVLPNVQDNLQSYVDDCFFPEYKDYYVWFRGLWKELSGSEAHFDAKDSDGQRAMDIAATIQCIFEKAILQCVNQIDAKNVKNLCLGGGSMLNCTTNSLLLKESQFENVHLFPACGDEGYCIGTALYVAHHILGEPRVKYTDADICFLGPDRPKEEPDCAYLAQEIAKGKIIAWCNGRAEFGPRALGNRSILADPRDYETRERINFKIKNREWYRPLAPVVLEEHAAEWFDFPTKSPFMLFTMPMKYPERIPAANHIDNTARIQTIKESDNPYYYRLIKEFYDITGVPILMNTSLNENGMPLVESDEDALEFFNRGTVDILVLNGKIIKQNG